MSLLQACPFPQRVGWVSFIRVLFHNELGESPSCVSFSTTIWVSLLQACPFPQRVGWVSFMRVLFHNELGESPSAVSFSTTSWVSLLQSCPFAQSKTTRYVSINHVAFLCKNLRLIQCKNLRLMRYIEQPPFYATYNIPLKQRTCIPVMFH